MFGDARYPEDHGVGFRIHCSDMSLDQPAVFLVGSFKLGQVFAWTLASADCAGGVFRIDGGFRMGVVDYV